MAVAFVILAINAHHPSLLCNLRITGQQLELSEKFKERGGDAKHHMSPL